MTSEPEIHPVQAGILKVLIFAHEARFSDLNTTGLSTDHFTFHVKRLADNGLIEKLENGNYRLTTAGKEFANRFDSDTAEAMKIERQAKLGVRILPIRKNGDRIEYLLDQRLKQPYYGFYGFLGGKMKWGETIYEAAARELKEESGLEADLTLKSIKHKMDYTPDNKILEDKFFFRFRGDNVRGEFIDSYPGGRSVWLTKEEIQKLPDLFPDVLEGMESMEREGIAYEENKYTAEGY